MSRFVRPETVVLTISQGDTLTVKKRLNHGEQQAAFTRMYLAGVDGQMRTNPLEVGLHTVAAYLLDWSLKDDQGQQVVIRDQPLSALLTALNNLAPEDFVEIRDAIYAHQAEQEQERAAEKNGRDGERAEPVTLPSPVVVTGVSTGSVS